MEKETLEVREGGCGMKRRLVSIVGFSNGLFGLK